MSFLDAVREVVLMKAGAIGSDCWDKMTLVAAFGAAFWVNRPRAARVRA